MNDTTVSATNPTAPAPPLPEAAAPSPATPDAIAQALMSALESRTKRVEAGVAKSMAEQYGIPDEEITQILQAEKAKRAAQLPPEAEAQVKAQLEKAHGLLVAAEVKTLGASMGLVDADAALLLMSKDGIKVDDSGSVAGAKEALEQLKTAKPYLFAKPGAWGERQGASAPPSDGVSAAFAKLNPNLKLD